LFKLQPDLIADAGRKLNDYFTIQYLFEPEVIKEYKEKIVKNMS